MASTTQLVVHIVWITKYRRKVLVNDIKTRCRELIKQGCLSHNVKIKKGVVSTDHIHLVVEYPPYLSISKLVKELKGRSSRLLQEEFSSLRKQYWAQHFWAVGYGAWSVGSQSEEQVLRYLDHHKQSENENDVFILEP